MALGPALVAILLAPEAYWPVRRVGAEYHAAADGAVALDAILAQLEPTPSELARTGRRPTSAVAAAGRGAGRRRHVRVCRVAGPRHP